MPSSLQSILNDTQHYGSALRVTRRAALGAVASTPFVPLASAADYQIIDVPVGHAVDAYFEINVSGKVYVRIETSSGPGCADFWWITWPLGRIQELGHHCASAQFEIPGLLSDLSVSSKLRAGGVSQPTKLVVADRIEVARSVTIIW
jgi:hypothetical protein